MTSSNPNLVSVAVINSFIRSRASSNNGNSIRFLLSAYCVVVFGAVLVLEVLLSYFAVVKVAVVAMALHAKTLVFGW